MDSSRSSADDTAQPPDVQQAVLSDALYQMLATLDKMQATVDALAARLAPHDLGGAREAIDRLTEQLARADCAAGQTDPCGDGPATSREVGHPARVLVLGHDDEALRLIKELVQLEDFDIAWGVHGSTARGAPDAATAAILYVFTAPASVGEDMAWRPRTSGRDRDTAQQGTDGRQAGSFSLAVLIAAPEGCAN
jgi:hypothetical protein